MIATATQLTQGLARHPAALIIGYLMQTNVNAAAIAVKAGYVPVHQLTMGQRHMTIYLPIDRLSRTKVHVIS